MGLAHHTIFGPNLHDWEMKDLWTPQRGLGSHDYGFAETVDASPMLWITAHFFVWGRFLSSLYTIAPPTKKRMSGESKGVIE